MFYKSKKVKVTSIYKKKYTQDYHVNLQNLLNICIVAGRVHSMM